jgi:hypothetical protein
MDDRAPMDRINELVTEEHALLERAPSGGLTDADHARLQELEVELDQCWDLLRQRRARRSAGQDPTDATVRPPGVVEGYQQ